MKARTIRRACLGFFVLLVAGCASSTYEGPHSGFLPDNDYSLVKKMDAPGGGIRYAYYSDLFTPANYTAIMVDPMQFFPEPEPNDFVTADTLTQIRNYVDADVHRNLGAKVMVVNQPGPGVARLRLGITAVTAQERELKPYQYIPIALVVTGASWAIGGRPEDATVAFEAEVTDSVTHEPLLISIRGGAGEPVTADKVGEKKVGLDDFKALIDKWTAAAATELTKNIRAK